MITDRDWYPAILGNIIVNGEDGVGPRGMTTREVVNVSAKIDMSRNVVLGLRKPNYRFMVAEFLWMALGRRDLAALTQFNSKMTAFSDDGYRLDGAYGPWFRAALPRVLRLLRADPDSRQAFVKIGEPDQAASKDVPCTLSWQFLVRGGSLHMVANMRSSDAWLGIPYDVYSFSQIANTVAGMLGLPRGFLYLNLASSHLYTEHIKLANDVCRSRVEYLRSPALPGDVPPMFHAVLDGAWSDARLELLDPAWQPFEEALIATKSEGALAALKRGL